MTSQNDSTNRSGFEIKASSSHSQEDTTLRVEYLFGIITKYGLRHPLMRSLLNLETKYIVASTAFYIPLSTISVDINSVINEKPKHEIARRFSIIELINKFNHLIVLGEPGSGKSMLLNVMLLSLAANALEAIDSSFTNLLPSSIIKKSINSKDFSHNFVPWNHGPLIPIYIKITDLMRQVDLDDSKVSAKTLWSHIEFELQQMGISGFAQVLQEEIVKRGVVLMLDGLDEVPTINNSFSQLRKIIEDFVVSYPNCRIVVTGRNSVYHRQGWHLKTFYRTLLAPFSKEDILHFTKNWFEEIVKLGLLSRNEAQKRAKSILQTIFRNEDVFYLAGSPLMLTQMAFLKTFGDNPIPKTRQQLNNSMIDLAYKLRDDIKFDGTIPGKAASQLSSSNILNADPSNKRRLLSAGAFLTYKSALTGSMAIVSENDVAECLLQINQNSYKQFKHMISWLRNQQGLVLRRDDGTYEFIHESIRAFLAGSWLSQQTDAGKKIRWFLDVDPEYVQDVVFFAGCDCIVNEKRGIHNLTQWLMSCMEQQLPFQKYVLLQILAGRILVEMHEYAKRDQQFDFFKHCVKKVIIKAINDKDVFFLDRTKAADVLDKLGDPRFDPNHYYLPKNEMLGFKYIRRGKFWMGSEDGQELADNNEKPLHILYLKDFWINQYPVTVDQFAEYSKECGRRTGHPSISAFGNHPVVYVTWFDALDYCNWLQGKLINYAKAHAGNSSVWKKLADGSAKVALPSEAEWEKACRGTHNTFHSQQNRNDLANIANIEMNVGTTSSVGCFPEGTSSYGVKDMLGNVWEWTRSIWGINWANSEYCYPYITNDGRENVVSDKLRILRGGCFLSSRRSSRTSSRIRLNPANKDDHIGFRIAIVLIE